VLYGQLGRAPIRSNSTMIRRINPISHLVAIECARGR
jgi:hypothetical protein